MLPIDYPEDIAKFKSDYLKNFDIDTMQSEYDNICRPAHFGALQGLKVKDILISDFEGLMDFASKYESITLGEDDKEKIKAIFNYDEGGGKQRKIADFFVQNRHALKLSTCYFCNIDHINAFTDSSDYLDFNDFIFHASKSELMNIKRVGESLADAILRKREFLDKGKQLTDKDLLNIDGVGAVTLNNIKSMAFNRTANHFTIDHVINKADYPIVALSLFNFVPCCYSCNSKFKRDTALIDVNDKKQSILSPSSKYYSFHNDNSFRMFYKENKSNLSDVKLESDFAVRLISNKHHNIYSKYIEAFKLNARYKAHKSDVLDLVKKGQRYSKTKTKQIAKLLDCEEKDVRKDIFGRLLESKDIVKYPKSKLIADIARNIDITDEF
ncbi:HNH endonuclease [Vibrio sp. B1ASS3]|uniref:hypothetical protein n=1 Tax=Vibrio sp. B1ASS3 TaxID=2751176 RepID=UPI001ABA1D7F|nr:hypothetical protein [Vibrio sp. B1ASS3]CAD7811824.1 HNH endonuclease [Vibrio sp. B1ASS3]CAE6915993.1 HNH endonuclease [Vibrio sp. B1ASS3]